MPARRPERRMKDGCADRARPDRESALVRIARASSGGIDLSYAGLAQRAAADLWLRAVPGDHVRGFDDRQRVGGMRGQRMGIAPAGVVAVLRSLRSAGGEFRRPVRKPDVPAGTWTQERRNLRG